MKPRVPFVTNTATAMASGHAHGDRMRPRVPSVTNTATVSRRSHVERPRVPSVTNTAMALASRRCHGSPVSPWWGGGGQWLGVPVSPQSRVPFPSRSRCFSSAIARRWGDTHRGGCQGMVGTHGCPREGPHPVEGGTGASPVSQGVEVSPVSSPPVWDSGDTLGTSGTLGMSGMGGTGGILGTLWGTLGTLRIL